MTKQDANITQAISDLNIGIEYLIDEIKRIKLGLMSKVYSNNNITKKIESGIESNKTLTVDITKNVEDMKEQIKDIFFTLHHVLSNFL